MEDAAQVRLTIGDVAARLGIGVRTVRFWPDEGLVEPPARSAGGYRLYDAAAVARLDMVRTPRGLGLGLPAVRELLGVLHGRPPFEPSVPAVEWWIAALRAAS
jgi:DNA-binding transcriptional MerR regulator